MTNETKLGIGLATGMFYHAPAGTALPDYPAAQLNQAWKEVGDITENGIVLATDKNTQNLKNWAKVIKRVVMTDHTETIQAPIMDTTEESLKTVLGESNVDTTAANAQHGKIVKANLSDGNLPEPEAFLFLMKDGDDMIAIGAEKAQISAVDNVSFAPNSGITWGVTITAMEDGFQLIMDDGQKTGG